MAKKQCKLKGKHSGFKKREFHMSPTLISYWEKIKALTIIMAFNVHNNECSDKDKFSSLT